MTELAADLLWTTYHPLKNLGLPLGRRLTVARGASGQLVVFSPLRPSPAAFAELEQLGEIAAFILPSRLHDLFYDGYFERFPRARFLAGRASIKDHPRWPLIPIEPSLPELAGFQYVVLGGMPLVQEHVFLHEASGTLILADILANIPKAEGWFARLLMWLDDMGGKPRPSRVFRLLISSRPGFTASLREILAWNFDRIIGGHGEIVEAHGKAIFGEAFADFL